MYAAKNLIKKHEGLEFKAYRCPAGKWTIGYGRNLEDNGISEEEAEFLLRNDVKRIIYELRKIFDNWDEIDENRQAALIDMSYNLGNTKFLSFKNFIKAVRRKDWIDAKVEMLDSKWAEQVPERANELARIIGLL